MRLCTPPNINYRIFNDMCYTTCPSYTLLNAAYTTCSECHYSCFSCTGPAINNCGACASSDHRTINLTTCPCDLNYYDASVSVCVACDPTCLTCNGILPTNCLSCDSAKLLTPSGTTCVCASTQTFYGGTCVLCSSLNVGCVACIGLACTTCDPDLFRNPDGLGGCTCMTGYTLSASNLCQTCSSFMTGCSNCTNNVTCLACDATSYFNQTGSNCSCFLGMIYRGGKCFDDCGDGIVVILPCDDGNTVSGDGCSSVCQIETNYSCRNLSPTSPSECSYNQPLSINSLKKDMFSNTLTVQLKVVPALRLL
jgi:cysteine-rich repeat protein